MAGMLCESGQTGFGLHATRAAVIVCDRRVKSAAYHCCPLENNALLKAAVDSLFCENT